MSRPAMVGGGVVSGAGGSGRVLDLGRGLGRLGFVLLATR